MRSIVLAAVLALLGTVAHAQTQTLVDVATISMSAPGVPRTVTDAACASDGNDLVCDRNVYVTPNSRMGIGTNSPTAFLDITSSTWGNVLNLGGSDPSGKHLSFRTGTDPDYWLLSKRAQSVSGQSSNFTIFYNTSSTWVTSSVFTPAGSVGIGNSTKSYSPSTTLQVAGSIRIGLETSATLQICDADRTGAIRFTGGDFSFCRNGSTWEPLSSLGGGASKLASLTDVVTSGAVSGSVLAFNAATSSWTALPIQQVMSTTTMVSGWPDALRCSGTNGHSFFDLLYTNGSSLFTYRLRGDYSDSSNTPQIQFSSSGAVNAISYLGNWTDWMSDCASKSIAQHYATGTAFNFIGTANTSGSTALGDRITSGTSAVVINSATGIVSISQLGAVTSYVHPSLGYVGPGVSVTGRVSSTGLYVKTSAGSLSLEPVGGGSVQVSSSYYMALTGNGNGGITFNTGLGDASKTIVELMRIQPTGLVGIGTNGPNAKLDVSGTVSATDVFLAKTGGPCATLADEGRMFRSPISGRLQVCAVRY